MMRLNIELLKNITENFLPICRSFVYSIFLCAFATTVQFEFIEINISILHLRHSNAERTAHVEKNNFSKTIGTEQFVKIIMK